MGTTGRNEPCPCGSGRKFKRCCADAKHEPQQQSLAPSMSFPMEPIPSILHGSNRARVIWNKVHLRPASETFHEFLIQVVLGTFGKTWRGHQRSLTAASRHVVIDWLDAWAEATRRTVFRSSVLS